MVQSPKYCNLLSSCCQRWKWVAKGAAVLWITGVDDRGGNGKILGILSHRSLLWQPSSFHQSAVPDFLWPWPFILISLSAQNAAAGWFQSLGQCCWGGKISVFACQVHVLGIVSEHYLLYFPLFLQHFNIIFFNAIVTFKAMSHFGNEIHVMKSFINWTTSVESVCPCIQFTLVTLVQYMLLCASTLSLAIPRIVSNPWNPRILSKLHVIGPISACH